MSDTVKLSIIIPTLDRLEGLGRLLRSISIQKEQFNSFEVIVVDNHSHASEQIRSLVQRYQASGLNVKYLYQEIAGTANARNLGIENAKGDWLAFFDDDEVLNPNYLSRLSVYLQSVDDQTILGGPYLPVFEVQPPKWMKNRYFTISYGKSARPLKGREYLPGGNLVISKALIDLSGDYPTNFGPIGEKIGYGEDTLFVAAARDQGGKQQYDPELAIYHHIPAARMKVKWFIRQKILSSNAKARIYLLENPLPAKLLPRLKQKLSLMRSMALNGIELLYQYIKGPFRNRSKFPFVENYIIEEVIPVLVKYKITASLFSLVSLKSK